MEGKWIASMSAGRLLLSWSKRCADDKSWAFALAHMELVSPRRVMATKLHLVSAQAFLGRGQWAEAVC